MLHEVPKNWIHTSHGQHLVNIPQNVVHQMKTTLLFPGLALFRRLALIKGLSAQRDVSISKVILFWNFWFVAKVAIITPRKIYVAIKLDIGWNFFDYLSMFLSKLWKPNIDMWSSFLKEKNSLWEIEILQIHFTFKFSFGWFFPT
jgi:hypothetical protein